MAGLVAKPVATALDQAPEKSLKTVGKLGTDPKSTNPGRDDAAKGRQRRKSAVTKVPEPPKTAKGQKRRQEIIEAATRALNRCGYRDLSISQIIAEANAPTGLFYRYFANKAEVTLAALEELVDQFRATLPTGDGDVTFFQRLLVSHRNLIRLFAEKAGLLGCYYSFDFGEPAFAAFFHRHTLRFDHESAVSALQALDRPILEPNSLIPLAHALTSMIDNFAFRYSTGRDETPTLEKASKTDLAWLSAMLRHRGFVLSDPVGEQALPKFVPTRVHSAASRRRVEVQEPRLFLLSETLSRRSPQRADSLRTFNTLKETALGLLNRLSYDDMRIADIENEGRTTRGSIYHYFGEKRDLVLELLRERFEKIQTELRAHQPRFNSADVRNDNIFEDLCAVIGTFVSEYHENPGILRTIYQLEDRDPEFGAFSLGYRRCWAGYIADVLSGHLQNPVQDRQLLEIIAYALMAMTDRFAYDLFVLQFPELRDSASSVQTVTRFLATVWYRIIFLENPRETVPCNFPIFEALTTKKRRDKLSKADE